MAKKQRRKKNFAKFSYRRLKGRIVEIFGSAGRFAEAMGMSRQMLSSRLKGRTPFTVQEIWYARGLLQIPKEDVYEFFFTLEKKEEVKYGG